ncbi:hypothetical protein MMC16_007890, partial [Acarospora aff. strigata]|nr:hypothetical protein [Acarospora aff. strigata]
FAVNDISRSAVVLPKKRLEVVLRQERQREVGAGNATLRDRHASDQKGCQQATRKLLKHSEVVRWHVAARGRLLHVAPGADRAERGAPQQVGRCLNRKGVVEN